MRILTICAFAATLLLVGCGDEPTVNARGSDEERTASIEAVKASIPAERQAAFEEAMKTLLFADLEGLANLADGEGIARRFADRVHGLTGEEVIAEADRMRELKAERERQRKLEQINELASKLEAESNAEVSRFAVERARFETSDSSCFGRDATIELSVINGKGSAVSRAYFHALLLTPGREIPWVDAEFNYEIPGGLEPGEQASWRLSPNMFGEWSKAPDDRLDTIFVVRAVQLDGADGEPIGAERLSDFEEEQLLELLDSMEGNRVDEVRALLEARRADVLAWRENGITAAALQERDELQFAREQLSQIRVLETRLAERRGGFVPERVVEALIENGSPSVIEWVRGEIRFSSPDRQVPWDEGRFIGLIRPGLEPGAQTWVGLSKSSDYGMGRWSLPPEGTDADTHVRIESAEAPESVPPFELEFTTRDEQRLASLEAMIAAQNWDR